MVFCSRSIPTSIFKPLLETLSELLLSALSVIIPIKSSSERNVLQAGSTKK